MQTSNPPRRRGLPVTAGVLVVAALAVGPVIADPLDGVDEYPRAVLLARNDVPFDSLGASAVAAQLGAPVVITAPTALSDAARDAIVATDPEVIIVAGGTAAISSEVAEAAAAACTPNCIIDRRGGSARDATAALLADVPADYGITAPVVVGDRQVTGDVHVGGTVAADALAVQSADRVERLNADRVDGVDAADLASFPLDTRSRGNPRLPETEDDATVEEWGTHVHFGIEPGSTSVVDFFLDLPGPAAAGGRSLVLTGIELCYQVYGTDDTITGAVVRFGGDPSETVEWDVDLGYNVGSAFPDCVPLGNPPIAHVGNATLALEWHNSEVVGNALEIFGVTTTWMPAGD